MAFTRNWDNNLPIDKTKFKNAPGAIRSLAIDCEDRLASILYGFTSGETFLGIKLGRFITTGTNPASAPPGTGAATAFDVYARADGTGLPVELWGIGSGPATEIQFTKKGKIPLDLSARLANNGWLIARNFADAANVNILKANTANAIEFASHVKAPDTAPAADLDLAPKGYVDSRPDGTTIKLSAGKYIVGDSGINTNKLKTGVGEVNQVAGATALQLLPGGEFGFWPSVKGSAATLGNYVIALGNGDITAWTPAVAYQNQIHIYNPAGATIYVQQRYMTASGTDLWVFLLLNKTTHKIQSSYQAHDHPAYGNGGDFNNTPHPFSSYDETKHEIVLLDKKSCVAIKEKSKELGKSILTVINENGEVDMAETLPFEPMHSGKFLTEDDKQVKQMITGIPDYIKVRRLIL